MKKLSILLICIAFASLSANAQPKSGGTIHTFGGGIFLLGVSPDGQYVTGYRSIGATAGTLLWTKAGGLTTIDPGESSEGYAVANNGVMAGRFFDPDLLYEDWDGWHSLKTAAYYKNNQWNSLPLNPGVLPILEEMFGSEAEGISADGTMVGGSRWEPNWKLEPAIWTNGEVDVLEYENEAKVRGLSADGTVACGWMRTLYEFQPVVWVNGVLRKIKQNDVWANGDCLGISPNGRYVALQANSLPAVYDVELDELTIIGMPPYAVFEGYASAVSNNGVVVGWYQLGLMFDREGFIYTPQLGRMKINDYLADLGIPEAATTLMTCPNAISADGRIIAGHSGPSQSWIVEIDKEQGECNPPENLKVEYYSTDCSKAELTWDAPAKNDFTYNIYRDGALIKDNHTSTSYTDSGLELTEHTWEVTVVCEDEESEPASKTLPACIPPLPCDEIKGEEAEITITCEKALLAWTVVTGAIKYEVSRDGLLLDTVTDPTYTETGEFEDGKSYKWEIVTVCEENKSDPVEVTGVADCVGIKELSNSVAIYPNPVKDILKVSRSTTDKAQVDIYNLAGSLVQSLGVNNKADMEINVSALPSGIYLIRLTSFEGDLNGVKNSATKRFIKN
jgi:uncharacterized membrane protein